MEATLYDRIIEHANNNYKTVGKSLFDCLDKIGFTLSEIAERNNINNHNEIDRLQKLIEYRMEIYAKQNKIV